MICPMISTNKGNFSEALLVDADFSQADLNQNLTTLQVLSPGSIVFSFTQHFVTESIVFPLLKCSLISGAKVYQVPASQSHIWYILGYHPNPVARNRLTSNSVHFLSSTSPGSLWSHPLQTPPSIAYHQFLQLLLLPPDSIPLVFLSHPGFFTHPPFREMSQSTSTIELFSYTSTSLPTSKAKRGGESNSLPHSRSQPIPTTSSCTQSLQTSEPVLRIRPYSVVTTGHLSPVHSPNTM